MHAYTHLWDWYVIRLHFNLLQRLNQRIKLIRASLCDCPNLDHQIQLCHHLIQLCNSDEQVSALEHKPIYSQPNSQKALIEFKNMPYCRHCNPNLDLWTFNLKPIPLVWYPHVIPYTKSEHFWIIRFGVMLQTIVWKMHLLTLWS